MDYKPLGRTGELLPEVGLGTWRYRGGAAPLLRGLELGANLIDTAEMYRTEAAVGQAIAAAPGPVFLATKVSGSHLRRDEVLRAAEASLQRLQVPHIDLYQVHWPNRSVPMAETMGALEELAERGLVRYIGVSNFSVAELQAAQAALRHHPIVSNQVLYNLKARRIERDLLPYCAANGITILAYTPLADGSLAGRAPGRQGLLGGRRRHDTLWRIAAETGKTAAQVALNWCLTPEPVVVIPKSNSIARTEENCAASGWRLTDEQRQRLEAAYPADN